jgi:beta-phosphoglucomutase-like phosphatase (HAD superfamily)
MPSGLRETPGAAVTNDRAVIFDMDGVLVKSEPLPFLATQEILAMHEVTMSEADYFGRYIVYSDWEIMELLLPDASVRPVAAQAKSRRYLEPVGTVVPPFPTVCDC